MIVSLNAKYSLELVDISDRSRSTHSKNITISYLDKIQERIKNHDTANKIKQNWENKTQNSASGLKKKKSMKSKLRSPYRMFEHSLENNGN